MKTKNYHGCLPLVLSVGVKRFEQGGKKEGKRNKEKE